MGVEMEKAEEESVENFIDKLLENDDEFPEFDVHPEWVGKESGKETSVKLKEDNEWDDDDDDAKDEFSLQLKKELDYSSNKDGSST